MDPGGKAHMKLWFYLILQGYFGYENDRTHVIKVLVLVVKITIQKKEVMQWLCVQ